MADDDIVRVRLSGANISRLAGKIAELDGWTVIDRSRPRRNKRDPGERVYMTVRYGYPHVSAITAWLAANGWQCVDYGPAGERWYKPGQHAGTVGVPRGDSDPEMTRAALNRIAKAEGRPLHELLTAIEKGAADG